MSKHLNYKLMSKHKLLKVVFACDDDGRPNIVIMKWFESDHKCVVQLIHLKDTLPKL